MNALDAIRKRAEAYRTHGTPGLHAPQDRAALLEAVETVLDVHKPFVWDFGFGPVASCRGCEEQGVAEAQAAYPCPTVRALTAALGDER